MITVHFVTTADEIKIIRALFKEYEFSLGVDLSFQKFNEELGTLPGKYSPPAGRLLLAYRSDEPAGCAAVRKIMDDVCELKRMYVRPTFRGQGIGKQLAVAAIEAARQIGYHRMRLDTLPDMTAAITLYRSLGFTSILPYRHNPVPGALFMELKLE
ncbi:MAG: GNAT family N-acetyltransferase [Bacteroidota bacterium]